MHQIDTCLCADRLRVQLCLPVLFFVAVAWLVKENVRNESMDARMQGAVQPRAVTAALLGGIAYTVEARRRGVRGVVFDATYDV